MNVLTKYQMQVIDLNCDMGELQSHQKRNFDEEIMPYISSCNIACGFHSGTPLLIERTIKIAIKYQVKIGAHPSYNDRENFGRVSMEVDRLKLLSELKYQICAVKGMVESFGQKLNHVKPHGALYNDMIVDQTLANQVIQLIKSIDPTLKIVTLAHSQVIDICRENKMEFIHEGFADRCYQKINQLRSRNLEGAVLENPKDILQQIDNFVQGKVQLYDSEFCPIQVESICLHSDTKGAVKLSEMIYNFLKEKNIRIG
ncbi:MAG: 5-oxoprolinase subunit PxpA [Saprospiraceae bacterium]